MFYLLISSLFHVCLINSTHSYTPLPRLQAYHRIFNHERPQHSSTTLSAIISDAASLDKFKKRLMESIEQSNEEKLQLARSIENVETMTTKELQEKWLRMKREHKIEDKSKDLMSSLHHIASYMLTDGRTIILTDEPSNEAGIEAASPMASQEHELAITEDELKRLWNEHSTKPFGKHISRYNEQEALLLVYDEDDEFIIGDQLPVIDPSSAISKVDSAASSSKTKKKKDQQQQPELVLDDIAYDDGLIPIETVISRLKVDEDEPELFISAQVSLA
jgi:hypothetical protein